MKLRNLKVHTDKIEASIQVSWLKTKKITIPTRKMMYVFSDPSTWDEVAIRPLEGSSFKELADLIFDMADKDSSSLTDILLKISGQHHNSYENEMFRQMLAGRN